MSNRVQHPLTVRCVFCAWTRTGREKEMLAAQREHRREHVQEGDGRPS